MRDNWRKLRREEETGTNLRRRCKSEQTSQAAAVKMGLCESGLLPGAMTYSLGRGDRYIGAWDATSTTDEMRDNWIKLIREEEARSRGGMVMSRSSDPEKDETSHMTMSTAAFAQSLQTSLSALHTHCSLQYCLDFIGSSLSGHGRDRDEFDNSKWRGKPWFASYYRDMSEDTHIVACVTHCSKSGGMPNQQLQR